MSRTLGYEIHCVLNVVVHFGWSIETFDNDGGAQSENDRDWFVFSIAVYFVIEEGGAHTWGGNSHRRETARHFVL